MVKCEGLVIVFIIYGVWLLKVMKMCFIELYFNLIERDVVIDGRNILYRFFNFFKGKF